MHYDINHVNRISEHDFSSVSLCDMNEVLFHSDLPRMLRVGPRIRRRPAAAGSDGGRRRRRRTAFSEDQLRQLRADYDRCRYIDDRRRRRLADRLRLDPGTVKIWFQNRRAADKRASGVRNELALRLMAEGLYDHHTVDITTTSR